MTVSLDQLNAIARQFSPPGRVPEAVRPYGRGNVNDTFLVTLQEPEPPFILQRLNPRVFRRPDLVMQNLRIFTGHVLARLGRAPSGPGARRWEVPRLLLTRALRDHFIDEAGSFWRALSFIDGRSFDAVTDPGHAREVGYALGRFHALLSDLDPARLADTLPGFHLTPGYLRHYDEVLARSHPGGSPEVSFALGFISRRRAGAGVLEDARARGELKPRPIHGDPKVNNVMLEPASGQAVALVDLDTVKPGLVQYDIGDCLRSACNPLGEETDFWDQVCFEPELCRAILKGYLASARDFLTENDYAYLYDAVRLITFELGLRFFTDYLAGNVYFKARHREHNLTRALVQFRLTESIESQAAAIAAICRDEMHLPHGGT